MKTRLSSYLIGLLFMLPSMAAVADNVVTTSVQTVADGTEWTLGVNLESTDAFVTFQMDIVLPSGITADDATLTPSTRLANHELRMQALGDGRVRVIAYALNNAPIAAGSGELFRLNLQAAEPISGADAEVVLRNNLFTRTPGLEEVTLPAATAYLPASASLMGDLNSDGHVTVLDVTIMVNLILNDEYDERGDFNGNGALTVYDLTRLIQAVLDAE